MMYSTLRPLILGSQSPRRSAFLEQLGLTFTIDGPEIDESVQAGERPSAYVCRMAQEKCEKVVERYPDAFVLTADTAVCFDEVILGKPSTAEEAVTMLMALSGRRHEVWGGVCLCTPGCEDKQVISVVTGVYFSAFDETIARAYVAADESLDKAGAYGIQGVGGVFVERVDGSYSNVVGLPLAETLRLLVDAGVVGLTGSAPLTDNS